MSGWAKLMSSILHSTVWLEADHVRLVWITLLALADRHGNVEASVPGLAVAARVELKDCQDAIERLMEPDPHSRTKEHEGRRIEDIDGGWWIINYEKHRNHANEAAKRESKTARQARWRDKKRREEASTGSRAVDDHDEIPRTRARTGSGSGSGSVLPTDPEEPDRSEPHAPEEPELPPIQERATTYLADPMGGRMEFGAAEEWPEILELVDVWGQTWKEALLRGGLRDTRLRMMLERLSEGFTVAELAEAIRGSRKDEFLQKRKTLQTMSTVLKDAAAVDKYRALLEDSPTVELTGMAKRRQDALAGHEGPRAKRLASEIADPMRWYYAMEAEETQ